VTRAPKVYAAPSQCRAKINKLIDQEPQDIIIEVITLSPSPTSMPFHDAPLPLAHLCLGP
jgi:hypothetical protein